MKFPSALACPCDSDLAAHAPTPARPHRHGRLTARQSLAMCRLSGAELRSMRRNSVRSIPDLLLQRRPSMSAFAKVLWRPSHKSHRRSTEPSELPGTAGRRLLCEKNKQIKNRVKFRATCQTFAVKANIQVKTFSCVCWQVSIHTNIDECFVCVTQCLCCLIGLFCIVCALCLHKELDINKQALCFFGQNTGEQFLQRAAAVLTQRKRRVASFPCF